MPKSKTSNDVIHIAQGNLVDAKAMGALVGFTSKWINRMASAGKIPWHGVRNGAYVYRRYNPSEVMAALAHCADDFDSASSEKKVTARSERKKELRAKGC